MDFEALAHRLELEAQKLKETIAVANHRLTEIETFLRLGRRFTGQSDPDSEPQGFGSCRLDVNWIGPADSATQRDRILDASHKLLRDGRRRSIRELLGELQSVGVIVGGLAPQQTLSTYLSRDKERFSSDVKKGGWTLRQFESMPSFNRMDFSGSTPITHFSLSASLDEEDE